MDLAKVKDTSDIENSISNVANTDYTQAMDNQQALDAYDSRAQSMEVGQLNKSGAEKASGVLGAVVSGAAFSLQVIKENSRNMERNQTRHRYSFIKMAFRLENLSSNGPIK